MDTLAFMGMPGGSEMMIVFLVILLLFGAKRLPELSRSLGKSLGEFRKGQEEDARLGSEPEAVETNPEE